MLVTLSFYLGLIAIGTLHVQGNGYMLSYQLDLSTIGRKIFGQLGKKEKSIGRLQFIPPSVGEYFFFYLRVVL